MALLCIRGIEYSMARVRNWILDGLALVAFVLLLICLFSAEIGDNAKHWLETPVGSFGPFDHPVYPTVLLVMATCSLLLLAWLIFFIVRRKASAEKFRGFPLDDENKPRTK